MVDDPRLGVREQALVDRNAYQQTIAGLEARQGVYGAELSEAYVGLGTTLRKLEHQSGLSTHFNVTGQALPLLPESL